MGSTDVEDVVSASNTDEAGPTRIRAREPSSWERRPKAATALRVAIALVPTIASFFTTFLIARYLPPSAVDVHAVLWWIGLVSCGFATLLIVDRTLRQLLPVVALLRLSLIFPDQAPSRFSIAMRTGTTRQLQRRIDEVRRRGLTDDHQEQAEHLLELVAALSKHDRMTRGHCERVRAYTDLLAEEMGLDTESANHLRWAALAHDVGKIFVPAEILNSGETPIDDDWEAIKSHTWLGEELVQPLRPWLGEWLDAVGQHHERWDGAGYPKRLRRHEIHLGARIVAVADAFDVMTSRRSYKKPMSAKLARAEIADRAGEQFDPEVARALMNISIGRLRFAIGPLTWLFNVPSASSAALTPLVAPAFTTATAATTTLAAAFVGHAFTPDPPLAMAAPSAVVAPDFFDESRIEASPTVTAGPVAPTSSTTEAPTAADTGVSTTRPAATPPTTAVPATAVATTAAPTPTTAITTPSTAAPTTSTPAPSTPAPSTAAPSTTAPAIGQPESTEPPRPKPGADELALAFDVQPDTVLEDGRTFFVVSISSPHQPITVRVVAPPTLGDVDITNDGTLAQRAAARRTAETGGTAQEPTSILGTGGVRSGDATPVETFTIAYTPHPDVVGTDAMTVEFCDGLDRCLSADMDVAVVPTPDAPVITPPAMPLEFVRSEAVEVTIDAVDPDGDELVFRASNLPAGLAIDAATGVISGSTTDPTDNGAFTVTVTDDSIDRLSSEIDVVFVLSNPPTPVPSFDQRLIISSARHHSSPGEFVIDEFVEITNVGDEPVDLTGVVLRDFAPGTERDRATKWGHDVDTSFVFTIPSTDRGRSRSILAPGDTARIWISEPCGTSFTIDDQTIRTEAFPHTDTADLIFVIDEPTWHRLDLAADDLWLQTADGTIEDFVRWRSSADLGAPPPSWWRVSLEQEQRWAASGHGAVVRFDHDRSHRLAD